ncbi:orotidine-5'-phosphate decarboxylase [Deltaproteobacteria bacterium TL4]
MSFYQKLEACVQKKKSMLCVGLDPVLDRIPIFLNQYSNPVLRFLKEIINATKPWAVAYKPNFAYFEALGHEGLKTLTEVIEMLPEDSVIIGDAKRSDVGHSAQMYAKAVFETFHCDAVTVSPYQGHDAIQPFLDYKDKGTFLLCLTSNPGADDFQLPHDLYLRVAEKTRDWNTNKNCGLVVGATHPGRVKKIREVSGPMPFLIPGIGAQGGSLEQTLKFADDGSGFPCLINVSRSVLYASKGQDYAEAAAKEAQKYYHEINTLLNYKTA